MSADFDAPDQDQNDTSTGLTGKARQGLSRRAVVGTAAWSVPIITVVSASPAFAASGATSLNRTTPATPTFTADQNSTTQSLQATLLNGTTPVSGKTVTFSIAPTNTFATLTATSDVTNAAGVATTAISYGATKPPIGTSYSVTAAYQDLSVSWTLVYAPSPNVVVFRAGDGSAPLTSASTAAFLDEFSQAGTAVSTTSLPTASSGANKALTVSGSATSEGELTLSTDGKALVLAGYATPPGTLSVSGTTSAAVNRVVGLVTVLGANPAIDTSTALTDFSSGNNPRSAVSTDGTAIWVAGGTGGIRYTTKGAATSVQLTTPTVNFRQVDIFDGQLYASSSSGTTRLATIGSGLPTTGTQTVTNVPLAPTPTSPYEYAFFNLAGTGTAPDTVYIADGNSINKYSLVGGSWTLTGSATLANVTGIAAMKYMGGVTIFASSPTTLARLTDASGFNGTLTGTPTPIATAGTNTAFRGVAFAPASA